jgi:hypothetical protein
MFRLFKTLGFLSVALFFSVAAANSQVVTPTASAKFTNLDKVTQNLVKTLGDPKLWGAFWDQKISGTGKIGPTNYKFSQIAPELKKYLQNGEVEIGFKNDASEAVSAETPNKSHIYLHPKAGSMSGSASQYSDYALANTIFHELMHVWQYRHWTTVGRFMDYEGFPTVVDKKLPRQLFDTTQTKDPGGEEPVPAVVGWQKVVGLWKTSSGAHVRIREENGDIYGNFEALGTLADKYEVEKDEFSFDGGKPALPKGNVIEVKGAYTFFQKGDVPNEGPHKKGHGRITVNADGKSLTFSATGPNYGFDKDAGRWKWATSSYVPGGYNPNSSRTNSVNMTWHKISD